MEPALPNWRVVSAAVAAFDCADLQTNTLQAVRSSAPKTLQRLLRVLKIKAEEHCNGEEEVVCYHPGGNTPQSGK